MPTTGLVSANRLGGVGGLVQPLGAEGGPWRPASGARGARQAPFAIDVEGADGQRHFGVGAASLHAPTETFAPEGRFEGRFARRALPAELFAPHSLPFGRFMPAMSTPPGRGLAPTRSPIGQFAAPGRLSSGLPQLGRLAPGSPMARGLPPMSH